MSDALGKPWIESAVTSVLAEHAHELPSPPKLKGRAQIVKFLTFREDSGNGRQPTDQDTELWAEITDRQWIMTVRIANQVTNKIEDKEKRALTYYRRGFFTLKASLSYEFVPQQMALPEGKSRIQQSSRKSLVLDIIELEYISGGGPGAPVATNSVALQTCPTFRDWESALSIGGRTLTNKQASMKAVLDAARTAKAGLRRVGPGDPGKRGNKVLAKTSAQPSPQPSSSADKLAVFHEWQDAYWGKRHKYKDMNFQFPREFDVAPDQQAILRQIEERIKNETQSQPYNLTNSEDRFSSGPNRQIDLPSFRSSQVFTSTPLDPQRMPSSPSGSQVSYGLEKEALGGNTDGESSDGDLESDNEDNKSDFSRGRRAQSLELDSRAVNREPSTSNPHERLGTNESDVEFNPQLFPHSDASSERSLEPDDAVSQKILTNSAMNDTTKASESSSEPHPRQPVVLVPDSDPPNTPSQGPRVRQLRGSSPEWDIEKFSPSQPRVSTCSPEMTKSILVKGKRRYSPALSSPFQLSGSLPNPTQHQHSLSGSQKGSTGSGQGDSQESTAAASLPSPPPEHPPTPPGFSQSPDHVVPSIVKEAISHGEYGFNEHPEEPFGTSTQVEPNDRPNPNPKKRWRSHSGVEGLVLAAGDVNNASVYDEEVESIKRRRLNESTIRSTRESATPAKRTPETREVQTDDLPIRENLSRSETTKQQGVIVRDCDARPNHSSPALQEKSTEGSLSSLSTVIPDSQESNSRGNPTLASTIPQGVIPHDHVAWSVPSYMSSQSKTSAKEAVSKSPKVKSASPSSILALGAQRRPALKPRPGIQPASLARQLIHRPVSPVYPQVTASQVADADEDEGAQEPITPKVEPPTPLRRARTSRASILSTIPSRSRPSLMGIDSNLTNVPLRPPRDKADASNIRGARVNHVRFEGAEASDSISADLPSRDEARLSTPLTIRSSVGNTSYDRDVSAGELRGSSPNRKLLRGFRPSISPDLDEKFISTWDMWLSSVREAVSYWQDD